MANINEGDFRPLVFTVLHNHKQQKLFTVIFVFGWNFLSWKHLLSLTGFEICLFFFGRLAREIAGLLAFRLVLFCSDHLA
jgi:hypothetical protein